MWPVQLIGPFLRNRNMLGKVLFSIFENRELDEYYRKPLGYSPPPIALFRGGG